MDIIGTIKSILEYLESSISITEDVQGRSDSRHLPLSEDSPSRTGEYQPPSDQDDEETTTKKAPFNLTKFEQSYKEHFLALKLCTQCLIITHKIPHWITRATTQLESAENTGDVDPNKDMVDSENFVPVSKYSPTCPLCLLFLASIQNSGFCSNDVTEMQTIRALAYAATVTSIRFVFEGIDVSPFKGIRLSIWSDKKKKYVKSDGVTMFPSASGSTRIIEPVGRMTDCTRSWEAAKRWMKECECSHKTCQKAILPGKRPTRLVEVGSDNNTIRVCLSEGKPPNIKYLTLSHCWGEKPFTTLNANNRVAFMKNVQFHTLSKTFRDAITATRRLGFLHIWIDSLCIIQGDPVDWATESENMGAIYANSSLNLAAIDSPNSETGLFFERQDKSVLGWRIPLEQESGVTTLWDCVPEGTLGGFDTNALSSRAWVFQERFLSPRTLRFGRSELSWECRTKKAFEASPLDSTANFCHPLSGLSAGIKQDQLMENWYTIVSEYSKGNLTVPSDKLTALAGIARLLSKSSGRRYYAGLWEDVPLTQFLWEVPVPVEEIKAYRSPSWSWASVDGEIQPLRAHEARSGILDSDVELIGFYVGHKGSAFENCPQGAHVLFKTRGLKSCSIATSNFGPYASSTKYMVEVPWMRERTYRSVLFDVKDPDISGEFFLLNINEKTGLVLRALGASVFRRVGIFKGGWGLRGMQSVPWEELQLSISRNVDSLTARESEVLGKKVGVNREGFPLFIVKLI